jgi:hypothetical protein
LGNGDGTFQASVSYAPGTIPDDVAVGDFNGDGAVDVAFTNNGGSNNTVAVLLGNGNGTFQSAVSYLVGSHPFWVTPGDFNVDTHLDLAVVCWGPINTQPGTVSVLMETCP